MYFKALFYILLHPCSLKKRNREGRKEATFQPSQGLHLGNARKVKSCRNGKNRAWSAKGSQYKGQDQKSNNQASPEAFPFFPLK